MHVLWLKQVPAFGVRIIFSIFLAYPGRVAIWCSIHGPHGPSLMGLIHIYSNIWATNPLPNKYQIYWIEAVRIYQIYWI
jgi:hypothetical protein